MTVVIEKIALDEKMDLPFVSFDMLIDGSRFATGEWVVDGDVTWSDGNMETHDRILSFDQRREIGEHLKAVLDGLEAAAWEGPLPFQIERKSFALVNGPDQPGD